ncbi:STN domain-containing protein [Bradyrhizobium sp. Ai1a-2]|uniref:STN domain-containing protein n=1 Tax=Bradyrhizobium sp. Ai1a-2 TaxID=196490 RepID=UPI00126918F2|nr:STN domain-containing protein [Bradyrhizobium sp. Ai1a-2]
MGCRKNRTTLHSSSGFKELLRKGWFFVTAGLLAVGILIHPQGAAAQGANPTTALRSAAYDIPAQDLDAALNVYMKVSGAPVLYEAPLTSGRRSMPVKGYLAPAPALRVLLLGTGLAARRVGNDAFSIVVATAQDADAPAAPLMPSSHFGVVLQASVMRAVCRAPKTRPGSYRIALALWIGPTGNVQSSALIGSTGDEARDAALIAVLQNVTVGVGPPAGMSQPIILTIAPRPPPETGDCSG